MKKTVKRPGAATDTQVLGDRAFAAITAVEGIGLSTASRKRLASMKNRKLTNDEKRAEVIRAYRETKAR